jgi:hypothetical protein
MHIGEPFLVIWRVERSEHPLHTGYPLPKFYALFPFLSNNTGERKSRAIGCACVNGYARLQSATLTSATPPFVVRSPPQTISPFALTQAPPHSTDIFRTVFSFKTSIQLFIRDRLPHPHHFSHHLQRMIVSDAALMPVPDNSIDENAIVFGIPHLQSERNSFSEAEGCRPVRSSGKENEEYC